MNFYRIKTRTKKKDFYDNAISAKDCRQYTDLLYHNLNENVILVMDDISNGSCTLVAAVKPDMTNGFTVEVLIKEFNAISGLDLVIKESEEISLASLKRYLKRAERNEYIESYNKLISEFDLDFNCMYKEHIAQSISPVKIQELSQELLYDNSLMPEIDRIYTVKNETGKLHHPVHYIVRCDNDDDYSEIVESLISSLYNNNRLYSKRYSELSISGYVPKERLDMYHLYSIQKGCTVVLKLDTDRYSDVSFSSNTLCEYIEKISRIINKFSRDVLTILVLPTICEKETEAIYNNTNTLFIEIYPENVNGERAKQYLSRKARRAEIKPTEALFDGIDSEKAYNSSELSEHFEKWYSDYIRNEIYPQYSQIKTKAPEDNNKRFGKALKELNAMIGLSDAKKIIHNALDYYKVQKMYQQFGKRTESPSMHMVFTGNPGTAKTTVARLFAQILKDNDVIKNGRLIEVGRADLVGKYVGHTAPLVRNAFESAQGGVLFIDEAYSLLEDKEGMFGDEAINTIVQEMENKRNETIVIFAGYPKEMEAFLDRNPGLRSRIAFHVRFEDYSAQELVDITRLMAKRKENVLSYESEIKLYSIFDAASGTYNFGNGRYARTILEKAEMNRASRLAKLSCEEITRNMLEEFIPEDFEIELQPKANRNTIGFNYDKESIKWQK